MQQDLAVKRAIGYARGGHEVAQELGNHAREQIPAVTSPPALFVTAPETLSVA